jgi:anti-anti-sigma factor
MHCAVEIKYPRAILRLHGRFDFSARHSLCEPVTQALNSAQITEIVVDLALVRYLDSSALGLLLVIQDKAKQAGKKVSLAGANGFALDVLHVANFHKRFNYLPDLLAHTRTATASL